MNLTTASFDLKGWRLRLHLTQAQAAEAVGLSLDGYKRAEWRAMDRPGAPVSLTLVKLAVLLEERG